MNPEFPEQIEATVRHFMELIVEHRFSEIVSWTRGRWYPESAIVEAIAGYPATLTTPPETFYNELIDAVEMEDCVEPSWNVVFPLWTIEEGRSDLSVELTCVVGDGPTCGSVEINAIHVR
ncbi:MAG: hypothetical protein KF831_15345 [Acidobacteria bacterium]|nr:hypothetical protein [Acidobacteriota bacterium]